MRKINIILLMCLLSLSSSIKISSSIKTKIELNLIKILSTITLLTPIPAISSNEISKIASMLPGMGPQDVIYPSIWKGNWKCNQYFTYVDINKDSIRLIPLILKKFNNNEPLVYTRSYIDIGDSKVVLDRSISQSNMWNALRNTNSKTITLWSSDNPNVSTIQTIDDGKLDEYKVLKRSVENSDSFFGYSEFSRIAETKVSLQYDVPKIFGFRQLARFREEDSDTIIGLERYYIYSGDTLDLNDKPLAIIKSKIIMKRE